MSIPHDRRRKRRYRIQLDLDWKLIRSKKLLDQGTGRTLDVSSGGLRFEICRPLPVGETLELSLAWPVMLHNITPLQLVATGAILRSDERQTIVRLVRYEFRVKASRSVTPPFQLRSEKCA
jgi:hypothetical protein